MSSDTTNVYTPSPLPSVAQKMTGTTPITAETIVPEASKPSASMRRAARRSGWGALPSPMSVNQITIPKSGQPGCDHGFGRYGRLRT